MGPTGCGRSEVIRVLARAIAIGAQAPTNPYLQANNKKKVSGLGGWLLAAVKAHSRHGRLWLVRKLIQAPLALSSCPDRRWWCAT